MDELNPDRFYRKAELQLLREIRLEVLPTTAQLQDELMRMQREKADKKWESMRYRPLDGRKSRFDEAWRSLEASK